MGSLSPFPESFECGLWDPLEDVFSQQQIQQVNKLGFCQYTNWIRRGYIIENLLRHIHNKIEWEVKVNKRKVSKETEQDLVLAPA